MLKIKDKFFIFLILIILILIGISKLLIKNGVLNKEREQIIKIKINNAQIEAEVSDTEELQFLGLSGRGIMDQNHGMLFIHEKPARYQYVMRGMLFDLDFIFIKENKIVDLARNISSEYKGTIKGGEDYDKVLELNAGWINENFPKIGDEIIPN